MKKLPIRNSKRISNEDIIPLSFTLIVYAVFNLVLVNKFFPITEGWFQDTANYINEGRVPYKDFYMFVPPGYPLLTALIGRLSNNTFLVFRLFGIVERLVLVTLTYKIMRRLFCPMVAAISSLVGAVVYIANIQEIFYGYYQTSLLCGIICIWLCIRTYEEFSRKPFGYAFFFGFCSALSFSFKQTLGLLLSFAVGVMLFVSLVQVDFRKIYKIFLIMSLGCLIFFGLTVVALIATDALEPMMKQVFGGTSSKGGLLSILFGFWPRILTSSTLVMTGAFLVFILLHVIKLNSHRESVHNWCGIGQWIAILTVAVWLTYILVKAVNERDQTVHSTDMFRYIFLLSLIVLGAGCIFMSRERNKLIKCAAPITLIVGFVAVFWVILTHKHYFLNFSQIRAFRQYFLYAVFLVEFIASIYLLYQVAIKGKREKTLLLIICVASWSIMYIHGFSYTIEDHSALLSISLFFGFLLSCEVPFKSIKQFIAMALACGLILTVFYQRNWFTYHWWGVNMTNTTYDATESFDDPHLRGIYANKETTEPMNEIYALVEQYKKKDSTMYTFPHIAYFNVMSELESPTFSKTHYFDVCCDEQAAADAEVLLSNSPDFIVWLEMSEETWQIHEEAFRMGERSGQREIQRAYQELISTNDYILLGKYNIHFSDPIYLWVKADLYYS